MTTYKALIIDDEAHPRELLLQLLNQHFPDIAICDVCNSGASGLSAIEKYQPEIVFLDVEMPGMTGFEMLQQVRDISFEVIFTTSFSKYALDAIRFSALDYLLKPIDSEALKVALFRFRSKIAQNNSSLQIQNLLNNFQSRETEQHKLALPTSNGYLFVRISDIIRCEAQNVYTTFFLTDKNQVVVSRTMKDCEEMLSAHKFHRIHQSHLINMRYLRRYTKGDGGEVEMEDGSKLEVSRRKKEEFLQALNRI